MPLQLNASHSFRFVSPPVGVYGLDDALQVDKLFNFRIVSERAGSPVCTERAKNHTTTTTTDPDCGLRRGTCWTWLTAPDLQAISGPFPQPSSADSVISSAGAEIDPRAIVDAVAVIAVNFAFRSGCHLLD